MIIVGIDPGVSGAVAFLNDGRASAAPVPLRVARCGRKEPDAEALRRMLVGLPGLDDRPALVVLEEVHPMPRDSKKGAFSFGLGVGKIKAVVEVLGLPLEEPSPQEWKRVVLKGTKKDKDAAVGWCLARHPEVKLVWGKRTKPHDGMAEAVAIAEYGRRMLLGELTDRQSSNSAEDV